MSDWHPYSHNAQRAATLWLAAIGVIAAWGWAAGTRAFSWTPPWWLDTPAVFGFYGLFYWAFNRHLWRMWPFRCFHAIPDLNGKYSVKIRTSFEQHFTVHEATAIIAQNWSHLIVRLDTESSTSCSQAAWLADTPGLGFTLTYVYLNSPKSAAEPTLSPHEGTTAVTFDPSRKGTGKYYTGRGRTNFGDITFEPRELNVQVPLNESGINASSDQKS